MDTNLHKLDYILNIDKFQKIQDDMAEATNMAVIAIDFKGNPVTRHSRCSDFCHRVRMNDDLRKLCEKCDSRGGLEAAREQEAYIYICHIGVVDFAIPIIVDDQYLGALMAGQVRLEDDKNNQVLERIVSRKYQVDVEDYPELKKRYKDLPVMSLDKIQAVAQMMYHIVNYIVEEAVLKTSLNELNQKLLVQSQNDQDITYMKKAESDKEVQDLESSNKVMLNPALKYIDEHYGKKIYLDEMAYLCNISSSYFSKIFKREMGCNFSTYINRIKVEKAKNLLETTSLPIINISLDLGFDDCGYFIKVFKKNYGLTPAKYRKAYKRQ